VARLATFPGYAEFPLGLARRVVGAVRPVLRVAGVLALAACSSNLLSGERPAQAPPPPRAVEAAPLPVPEPPPAAQDRVKVALLLPLTGPNAAIGQAMLNAAQLAVFDLADDRFVLLPKDTQGNPQGAANAARLAIAEGVQLVLGPLLSAEVAAAKFDVATSGLSMLAFTNDLGQAGGGAYVMGFVPQDQVMRVMGYTRSQGAAQVAALAPKSAYGDAVVDAFYRAAQQFGATVAWVERYDPQSPDLVPPVRSLASHQGFQALLLAEAGERAKAIATLLPANGVDTKSVRLMGTGLLDDATTSRDPALAGALYAAPAPEQRADFEARFEALYGRRPPRLATIAYDATALAAVLGRSTAPKPFDSFNLTNPSGFAGLDGVFRLRGNGQVERGLAVLQATADGPRVVDPAPTSFVALTQ